MIEHAFGLAKKQWCRRAFRGMACMLMGGPRHARIKGPPHAARHGAHADAYRSPTCLNDVVPIACSVQSHMAMHTY